jgi:hypothetical protein
MYIYINTYIQTCTHMYMNNNIHIITTGSRKERDGGEVRPGSSFSMVPFYAFLIRKIECVLCIIYSNLAVVILYVS